jgi:thioredoxin 1
MSATNAAKPVNVTLDTFQSEIIDSEIPVVIDFWAPWCGPCRMIGPVLERLAGTYAGRVKVAKINVDQERQLAGEFRIQGIPTLVALHGDKVVGHMVGFGGEKALEQLFEQIVSGQAAA